MNVCPFYVKKITRQKKSHSNNISKFKENDAIKKSNFRTCMTICEEEKIFFEESRRKSRLFSCFAPMARRKTTQLASNERGRKIS